MSVVDPTVATFTPPKFNKSRQEEKFIENVLQANFLFLEDFATTKSKTETKKKKKDDDLSDAVAAFEEVNFPEQSYLCKQGDLSDTDYLYIIYSGECSVFIDDKQLQEPYGTMAEGSLIGDIAMIYETARAATVQAMTPVKAFRLHRRSFNYFLHLKTVNNEERSGSASSSSTVMSPKEKMQHDLKEIDTVIDQIAGIKTKYGGDIIQPFKPTRKWLWSRWRGTIMQQDWRVACLNMLLCVVFQLSFRWVCDNIINQPISWSIGMVPDQNHPFVARLLGLNKLW